MGKYLFYSTLHLILLFTTGSFSADAQTSTRANARLDQVSMPLGDQTTLHLSITFPAKDSVRLPVLKDSIGKVQIVSMKADTSFAKDDISTETITQHITVTSFEPGTYTIPAFTFHTKTGEFNTKELTLQVLPVQVDTSKAFYDIKQPLSLKYTFLDWLRDNWYWVALPLFLIILVFFLYRYFKNRPRKQVQQEEVKAPALPEHELALNKLEELRNKKLWQQEQVKLYHSELTGIVREYLEKRFRIKAMEQTSEEIFRSLRHSGLENTDRDKLRQILTLADLVKFAKEKPLPAENEGSLDNAVMFVTHTQKKAVTPENKEGDSTHGLS